jgi:hypothetical protein
MAERVTDDDRELLEELGVEATSAKAGGRSAREQRIIAGFEEIERFVEENGRAPQHGEDRDIFERLYAVRLDRIRESPECRAALSGVDRHGLLGAAPPGEASSTEGEQSDEDLLDSLGVDAGNDLTRLVHVRSRDEINAAEDVARRVPCLDFHLFQPLFEQVQQELDAGTRTTAKYEMKVEIQEGDLFIHGGQKALVAAMGEEFTSDYERMNRKLRVIYDNGTENAYLLRSFQRALYKTPGSRKILKTDAGPLFSDIEDEDDLASGYAYVLRSQSDHPFVAEHRTVLHKIGVTGGDVKRRVADARKDPTFLLADVEIIAAYKLANINRIKLEALLHRFFAGARMDVELKDRFNASVEPREWFLVRLDVIQEVIQRLIDGTIEQVQFDWQTGNLLQR